MNHARLAAATLGILLLAAAPVLADPLRAVCEAHNDAGVCACAADRLRADAGAGEVALYEAVSAAYLPALGVGAPMSAAWEAALASVAGQRGMSAAEVMQSTNQTGRAHRSAIQACRG